MLKEKIRQHDRRVSAQTQLLQGIDPLDHDEIC